MGRVETRVYRRRAKRTKLLYSLLFLLLIGISLLLWRGLPGNFAAEQILPQAQSKVDEGASQSAETREVTLPEERWYAIQTGVFSTEAAALEKADAYTKRGAPGTVVQEGEKWRVFIACYGDEQDAADVRARLEANQKVETYLFTWTCPEVRLRMTGKTGQLDAVEAGFVLMPSTAGALRDTAMELDAAQLTTQEVLEAVSELEKQLSLWEDTVRSRFAPSQPELVKGMLQLTDAWHGRLLRVRGSEGATALSAALKAQAMAMYADMKQWRTALMAQ